MKIIHKTADGVRIWGHETNPFDCIPHSVADEGAEEGKDDAGPAA